MPEIAGIVNPLTLIAHESLGAREIWKLGRVLRGDDDEKALR
jgi:hypothetical protein